MSNFFSKISGKYSGMYIALAGGVICSLCHILFSVDLYRDSASVYAFMARALADGNISEAFHTNIPHLNVCCSYIFTLLGMSPEKAVTLISCLFFLATIPYLFFLLREFLPDDLAGLGVILFAFAPKILRFFCSALIDSGKVFFMVAALYYGYKLIKSRFNSYGAASGFGIALGLTALVRSEGIANAGILGICLGFCCIAEICRNKKFSPVLPLLLSMLFFGLLVTSRFVILGIFCGEWVYDKRIAVGICKILPWVFPIVSINHC